MIFEYKIDGEGDWCYTKEQMLAEWEFQVSDWISQGFSRETVLDLTEFFVSFATKEELEKFF